MPSHSQVSQNQPFPEIIMQLLTTDFVTKKMLYLLDSGSMKEFDFSEVHTLNLLSMADNWEKLIIILDLNGNCK